MQEVLHVAAQRFHEVAGTLFPKADQIDHDIGLQGADARTERSRLLLSLTVHGLALHEIPGAIGSIGRAPTPAQGNDRMARLHEPWRQIGADVPGGADHDNAQLISSPTILFCAGTVTRGRLPTTRSAGDGNCRLLCDPCPYLLAR